MIPNYDEKYVAALFDEMSASYAVMNLVSSFGFSEIWRAQCVSNLDIPPGATVADLMAGSGECWTYLRPRLTAAGKIISVDISPRMCTRQQRRMERGRSAAISIHCESALAMTLPDNSVDFIVSAFGLKTFELGQLTRLAAEAFRVLRPGSSGSFLEITVPPSRLLSVPYRFYLKTVIPLIGDIFLNGIECYRMLGVYTEAFGSCNTAAEVFRKAGFEVTLRSHFFGCASSFVAMKPGHAAGDSRGVP